MGVKAPQHVINAMGVLVLYFLGRGLDVDGGCYIEINDMSMGEKPNDTALGGWRVTVKRISKPEGEG